MLIVFACKKKFLSMRWSNLHPPQMNVFVFLYNKKKKIKKKHFNHSNLKILPTLHWLTAKLCFIFFVLVSFPKSNACLSIGQEEKQSKYQIKSIYNANVEHISVKPTHIVWPIFSTSRQTKWNETKRHHKFRKWTFKLKNKKKIIFVRFKIVMDTHTYPHTQTHTCEMAK